MSSPEPAEVNKPVEPVEPTEVNKPATAEVVLGRVLSMAGDVLQIAYTILITAIKNKAKVLTFDRNRRHGGRMTITVDYGEKMVPPPWFLSLKILGMLRRLSHYAAHYPNNCFHCTYVENENGQQQLNWSFDYDNGQNMLTELSEIVLLAYYKEEAEEEVRASYRIHKFRQRFCIVACACLWLATVAFLAFSKFSF